MYFPLTAICRSVVDATSSAIVSCLFKLLTTHADPEVLASGIEIVRKALAIRAGEVDSALYEGAKIFVLTWPKKKRGGVVDGENPSATNQDAQASSQEKVGEKPETGEGRARPAFERFEPLVMAVLDSDPDRQAQQPEHIRKSRVGLAVAFVERGVQESASLAAILDAWLKSERSRPLREDVERARLMI